MADGLASWDQKLGGPVTTHFVLAMTADLFQAGGPDFQEDTDQIACGMSLSNACFHTTLSLLPC